MANAAAKTPEFPSEIFPGALGDTQAVRMGDGRTWGIDIPTTLQLRLLEGIKMSLSRLEGSQVEILTELRKHTDALREAVERDLEPIVE